MLVKDLRRDFYDVISKEHVVVIANVDVDAVCAFKILQFLFRCDHVSYTLVPVSTLKELRNAVGEHAAQAKYTLLLNCGAFPSLIETIGELSQGVFFILDSRRPFDVNSVFDREKFRVLIKPEEETELNLPNYGDLYDDMDEEADEENGESDGETSERNDDGDEELGNGSDNDLFASPKPKRHKRPRRRIKDTRKWEENRGRILYDYYEFSTFSYSSAVLLFELAWKLSKDNGDLLWWACIGLTSQFLERQINLATYVLRSTDLHQHLQRINRAVQDENGEHLDRLKVAFEKDLLLSLYRRWSLFESLRHTAITACHFKAWTFGGECKMQTFLADLGLPLTQCRQRYSAMDANLRKEMHKAVEEKLDKYGLGELIYVSFSAQYSFGHKVAASDTADAIASVLNFGHGGNLESNFLTALDCLSKSRGALLYECMNQCKSFMKLLWTDVKALLNSGHVVPQNAFLLAQLTLGTPGWCYFSKPYGLLALGHCLLRAFCSQRNGQKHRKKPMIVMIPCATQEDGGNWLLVAGIPPTFTLSEGEKPLNCMGSAFQQVAQRIRCRMVQDFFVTSVLLLKAEDKDRFCNSVSGLLEV